MPLGDAYSYSYGGLYPDYVNGIRRSEGFAPRAQWDYAQYTNGYGTRARYPGEVIDKAEADRRFNDELGKASSSVRNFAPSLDPGTHAALTSLTFNGGNAWQRSGLGAAIQSGDLAGARDRFLQYVNAGGHPLSALVDRRNQESQWFGQSPNPQPADGMDAVTYGASAPPPQQQPQPQQQPAPMGAPQPMPIGDAAPDQQQPGYLDRLMVNPMFMAGLSILGTKPGGDWGPNAANASANTLKMAMAQNDFQRKQQSEAVRDRVWSGAFPGGKVNPDHPLTKGIPPDLLASVYAMGPDAGVPELAKLAMFSAENRQKLLLQQQMGEQMARAVFGQYGMPDQQGQPTAQPDQQQQPQPSPIPPQTASIPAPAMPAGPAGTTVTGPGPGSTMNVPASAIPTMAGGPTGGQPQPPGSPFATPPNYNFRGGTRSEVSSHAVLADPDLRRIMYGHIMAGKPDEAMKAYQSALEKAQAPRLAGETKYAQETADNQAQDLRAQQSFREAGSLLDKTERAARSLGDARLNAAASPTLDTWTGQNIQRHFQPQAYADRQQLLPYLEQMTVLARQQLKGQGSLSDQENGMLQKALTGARNATDAPTFYQQLNIARSILATKLPEMQNYVPPQILQRERDQAAQQRLSPAPGATPAPAAAPPAGNPLQPPQQAALRTDRLDSAELEGATVYDHKTGRWGTVQNGQFVPRKMMRGKTSAGLPRAMAE